MCRGCYVASHVHEHGEKPTLHSLENPLFSFRSDSRVSSTMSLHVNITLLYRVEAPNPTRSNATGFPSRSMLQALRELRRRQRPQDPFWTRRAQTRPPPLTAWAEPSQSPSAGRRPVRYPSTFRPPRWTPPSRNFPQSRKSMSLVDRRMVLEGELGVGVGGRVCTSGGLRGVEWTRTAESRSNQPSSHCLALEQPRLQHHLCNTKGTHCKPVHVLGIPHWTGGCD